MHLRFIAFILAFSLLSVSPNRAQTQSTSVQDSVVLRAMRDELARSIEGLKIANLDKPYFIEYAIEDAIDYTLAASFGAVTTNDKARSRSLRVRVRVGSYDFDNTGFVNPADFFTGASQPRALPFEDDYNALRHELWLATDAAYKQAVEALARKRAFVQNKQDDAPTPDFSRQAANVSVSEEKSNAEFEVESWTARVREMSNLFRDYTLVQDSNVQLRARFSCEYLVNSEGTQIREPQTFISLETRAAAHSADGARLATQHQVRARKFEDLPSGDELMREVKKVADNLTALREAPAIDENYSGPVLFAGQAASEMLAQIFVPHLADERPPLAESTELAEGLGFRRSALADRLGRPVLPRAFEVVDNPSASINDGAPSNNNNGNVNRRAPMFGSYTNDNQGVKGRNVKLIENGILIDFLASRRPRERGSSQANDRRFSEVGAHSNGHGRARSYGEPRAFISNLFVSAREGGVSMDDLKRRLIEACRAENLAYGFIVRELATPLSVALASDDASGLFFTANRETLSAPILIYRVDTSTGAEQLVRGAELSGLGMRALRRLLGWSKEIYTHARVGSNDLFASGDTAVGLPSTIIAPSVLIDEMDVRRATGKRNAPTLLTHPHFDKEKVKIRKQK